MRAFSCFGAEALIGVWLVLLVYGGLCYGGDMSVEVVGIGECGDCKENGIKSSHALSGLKVTVDCKREGGEFQTRGAGELDEGGNFKVSLPQEILKDGNLAEECYMQLRNGANAPCATHGGLNAARVAVRSKSKSNQKHMFRPVGKLRFSAAVCTSALLPPLTKLNFGHPFPLPPLPPKVFPFPPKIPFEKPLPPPIPVVKPPLVKPKPPVVPVHKPPVPVYKPEPKPKPPVYKSPSPVYKPEPKPKPPVYKPPSPVYKPKPKPPVYKPPTIPIYKPKPKPLPPPFQKPPCPPFSLPKLPPLPTLPPKPFHHPFVGMLPPLPPKPPLP